MTGQEVLVPLHVPGWVSSNATCLLPTPRFIQLPPKTKLRAPLWTWASQVTCCLLKEHPPVAGQQEDREREPVLTVALIPASSLSSKVEE